MCFTVSPHKECTIGLETLVVSKIPQFRGMILKNKCDYDQEMQKPYIIWVSTRENLALRL